MIRDGLRNIVLMTGCALLGMAYAPSIGRADQMDFGTYLKLNEGMSESEVLFRAGPPDRVIYFGSEVIRETLSDKQMIYMPEPGGFDPHLTAITIEKGKVALIQRIKMFSGPSDQKGGAMKFEVYKKIEPGMLEAQVIALAGEPTEQGYVGDTKRQLLYIPGPNDFDPHITVVTSSFGVVVRIERNKIVSP